MDVLTPRHDTPGPGADAAPGRRLQTAPLSVGLFNDSGDDPQVVSLAVSQAHRRMLQRAGAVVRYAYFRGDWHDLGAGSLDDGVAAALASPELRRVFADVDVVVMAGDTFRDRPHRHLLAILGAAQHLDVPTYLVNASIGVMDEGLDVLMGLADCSVRDAESARILTRLGVAHRRVADTILAAPFGATPVRDFAEHLVVTDCHPARRVEFTAELAAVRDTWPGLVADYPLDAPGSPWDWTHAVADLGSASAVLTGGRDGASLALKAGVPFVLLGADPAAIELVSALDGYPADAADRRLPLSARLAAAMAARAWFQTAGARCQARGPADIFSRLRPSLARRVRSSSAWRPSTDGRSRPAWR